jgi:hypothetical protein
LLREMAFMCRDEGCSLLIIHHTKTVSKERVYEPLELSDIAWAGFQESVRQWFLVNTRTRYEPGSGDHELWLNVGSSVGHGGLWGLDINEGALAKDSTRVWKVAVTKGTEAREQTEEAREQKRIQRQKAASKAKVAAVRDDILVAFNHSPNHAATKTKVRERVGQSRAFDQAWLEACNSGDLQECKVKAANGQEYDGFERIYHDEQHH